MEAKLSKRLWQTLLLLVTFQLIVIEFDAKGGFLVSDWFLGLLFIIIFGLLYQYDLGKDTFSFGTKVVDLASYRKLQTEQSKKTEGKKETEVIFEKIFVSYNYSEIELLNSFLQNQSIVSFVANRNSASILPNIAGSEFQLMVRKDHKEFAIQILQKYHIKN